MPTQFNPPPGSGEAPDPAACAHCGASMNTLLAAASLIDDIDGQQRREAAVFRDGYERGWAACYPIGWAHGAEAQAEWTRVDRAPEKIRARQPAHVREAIDAENQRLEAEWTEFLEWRAWKKRAATEPGQAGTERLFA